MSDTVLHNNKVCAVIVTYNGSKTISGTVRSLLNQVNHIIIIDNGSDDGTVEAVKALVSDKTELICNPDNMGIAFALNQGVRYAALNNYRWVLTMDQDSMAQDNMVGALLDCAEKYQGNGKTVSFSPVVEYEALKSSSLCDGDESRYTVITSGNLIDARVFDDVGYFEEKLFIDSVDFDFCLRLLSAGYRIVRCHGAGLLHSLGDPVGCRIFGREIFSLNHSATRKYYIVRNNIYILRKYLFRFPLFCIRKQAGMLSMLLLTLLLERDRVSKFKYMFKGTIDGIRGKYGRLQ